MCSCTTSLFRFTRPQLRNRLGTGSGTVFTVLGTWPATSLEQVDTEATVARTVLFVLWLAGPSRAARFLTADLGPQMFQTVNYDNYNKN